MSDDSDRESASAYPTPSADEVIAAFGGIRPMAKALGVAVSTVQGWKVRQHIPDNRWHDVVAAANAAGVDLTAPPEMSAPDPDEPAQAADTASPAAAAWGTSAHTEDATAAEAATNTPGGTERPASSAATSSTSASAGADAGSGDTAATSASAASGKTGKGTAGRGSRTPRTGGTGRGARTQPRGRRSGIAAWVAVGLGVVALLALLAEPYWRPAADRALDPLVARVAPALVTPDGPPPVDPARVDALAADIEALATRIDAAETRADAAVTPERISELAARINALEARGAPSAGGGAASGDLAALESRLAEMESALSDQREGVATRDSLAALRDRVTALEDRLQAQTSRLQEMANEPALKGAKEAAMVIAVGAVQDAVSDGRPFAGPLGRVATLAEPGSPVEQAAAELQPLAERGVPTRDALLRRFNAAKAAMHSAAGSAPESEQGFVAETISRVTGLVSLRRTGEAADRPPVSRAEAALARGDLAGAAAALDGIRGSSEAARAWLAAAEDRLTAEAALQRLREAATARLSGAAGVDAGTAERDS